MKLPEFYLHLGESEYRFLASRKMYDGPCFAMLLESRVKGFHAAKFGMRPEADVGRNAS